jgi:hypothetical protein
MGMWLVVRHLPHMQKTIDLTIPAAQKREREAATVD